MSERPRILALMGGATLFGQERGNIAALSALKEQGCDILCLIRDEDWSIHMAPALDAHKLAWLKVPFIQHLPSGNRFIFWLRNLRTVLQANVRFIGAMRRFRPTHLHTCNPVYILNFLPVLMSVRTPLVYRAGDKPTLHNWFWRLLWNVVVRRTTMFVANSNFVADSLRSSGVKQQKLNVIYNAPPKRPGLAAKPLPAILDDATRKIVFIGQIAEHKGPHLLVRAFNEVSSSYPSVHLILAGPLTDWKGDDWGRSLRNQAEVENNRVHFIGDVEDVPRLLAESIFLVVPSLFDDPAPNVVMEAKAAGRPAIVFPRGGLPELIENGVDGLICNEGSAPALVGALKTYLDDPETVSRHGAAAAKSLIPLGVADFGPSWLNVYKTAGVRQNTRRGDAKNPTDSAA